MKRKLVERQVYEVTGKTDNFVELNENTLIDTDQLEKETGELEIGDRVIELIYEVEGEHALDVKWEKLEQGIVYFDMDCPKCGKNNWQLAYEGDYTTGCCDKTENVGSYIGIYGKIVCRCRECGYVNEIEIGSD